MRLIRLLSIILIGIVLSSCQSYDAPISQLFGCDTCVHKVNAFDGDDKPSSEIAILAGHAPVWVAQIDQQGKDYKPIFDIMYRNYEVSLLPGSHEIYVATNSKTIRSPYAVVINRFFKKGHRYIMKPDFSKGIEFSILLTEEKDGQVLSEEVYEKRVLY